MQRQQAVYQIVPHHTMPKLSENARYFQIEDPCEVCEKRGKHDILTYHASDLASIEGDIVQTYEYMGSALEYINRITLFSKKFRDLIYQNKLAPKMVFNISDDSYGRNDWVFSPVLSSD